MGTGRGFGALFVVPASNSVLLAGVHSNGLQCRLCFSTCERQAAAGGCHPGFSQPCPAHWAGCAAGTEEQGRPYCRSSRGGQRQGYVHRYHILLTCQLLRTTPTATPTFTLSSPSPLPLPLLVPFTPTCYTTLSLPLSLPLPLPLPLSCPCSYPYCPCCGQCTGASI